MKVFKDFLTRNNGNGQISGRPLVTNEESSNGGGATPIAAASTSGIQVQPIAVKLDEAVLL